MNFLLYVKLKNYTLNPDVIFWPDFMKTSPSSLQKSIFESFWSRFTLDGLKKWG